MKERRVLILGVEHRFEFYLAPKGARARHKPMQDRLEKIGRSLCGDLGLVVEEAGRAYRKREELIEGRCGSVVVDFATAHRLHHEWADISLSEFEKLLPGKPLKPIKDDDEKKLSPHREKAVFEIAHEALAKVAPEKRYSSSAAPNI